MKPPITKTPHHMTTKPNNTTNTTTPNTENRRTYYNNAPELGIKTEQVNSHRPQHGVERSEVPDRRDVRRRLQIIGRLEVRLLEEQPAHFREEEHHNKEDEEEYTHAQEVMH